MSTFDGVSGQYAKKSLVQRKASAKLIGLMGIKEADAVLDVACGPGHITSELAQMTSGRVTGTDVSAGMIEQAKRSYPGIDFAVVSAEAMEFGEEFDIVFCNSALQWFSEPGRAVRAMQRALRKGGKMGVACPGTAEWAPLFMRVMARVAQSPEIRPVFAHWKNPWFMPATLREYREFFEACGFKTTHCSVDYEANRFSVEDAFGVYLSGAANGFIAKQYYDTEVSDEYVRSFNARVKEEFAREAKDGFVELDFNRVYYIGEKT